MRDDVRSLADTLVGLYRRKLSLIEQLRGNTAALRSFMLSDNLGSLDDVCAHDEAITLEADGIDIDIARIKDELSRITGLSPAEAFKRAVSPSSQGKQIAALRTQIDSVLAQTMKDRSEIIRELEKRSGALKRAESELEAMGKLREYTVTKEPML